MVLLGILIPTYCLQPEGLPKSHMLIIKPEALTHEPQTLYLELCKLVREQQATPPRPVSSLELSDSLRTTLKHIEY